MSGDGQPPRPDALQNTNDVCGSTMDVKPYCLAPGAEEAGAARLQLVHVRCDA